MVYVARILIMPSGEELYSKVVTITGGKVTAIDDFITERPAMVFVNEMHVAVSCSLSSVKDIDKEAHRAEGPLYAYSADASGILELLG